MNLKFICSCSSQNLDSELSSLCNDQELKYKKFCEPSGVPFDMEEIYRGYVVLELVSGKYTIVTSHQFETLRRLTLHPQYIKHLYWD